MSDESPSVNRKTNGHSLLHLQKYQDSVPLAFLCVFTSFDIPLYSQYFQGIQGNLILFSFYLFCYVL